MSAVWRFLCVLLVAVTASCQTIDQLLMDAQNEAETQSGTFAARMSGGDNVVELDILLTDEEMQAWLDTDENGEEGKRSKRKATPFSDSRWTSNTVPYTIASELYEYDADIEIIHSAMAEWEQHTCIKYRPANPNDKNFVKIYSGNGCSSHIGMGSGARSLSLGRGCRAHQVALHELGHSLGLFHEQSRRDRDDSIWVRTEHMQPKYHGQNGKKEPGKINNYGVPYDYASVMHYGQFAFANSEEPVIITHDPSWQNRIGRAMNLSFNDIKIVNIMYNCGGHCDGMTCPGEGFLDKDCQCQCPGNPTILCGQPKPEIDSCMDLRQASCRNRDAKCGKDAYVDHYCFRTCRLCGPDCKDDMEECKELAYNGDCKSNPAMMFKKCKKSCGLCYGKDHPSNCYDTKANCSIWASNGECNSNPNYMRANCKRSCASCEDLQSTP